MPQAAAAHTPAAGEGGGAQSQSQLQQQATPQLLGELLAACSHQDASVRIEALAALKGLATHYVSFMPGMCVRAWRVGVQ